MSSLELANKLQSRLKGRQDPAAQHLSLRVARAWEEAELLELQELIAKLPPPPQEKVSPLRELRLSLIGKISHIPMPPEQYERLKAEVAGEQCSGETLRLIFSMIVSNPIPKITLPNVRGPSEKARNRSNLLLALLTKMAQARRDGVRLVTPEELRKAMEAKNDAQLQMLLERNPPQDD